MDAILKRIDFLIHLEKFDRYQPCSKETSGSWGDKTATYKDLFVNFVTNPTTRLAGVETGQYDIAAMIAADDYKRAKDNQDLQMTPD